MPLVKIQFRPGINKEITTYANEGGFYNCDKVRFRFGFPEKLGGWVNQSQNYTFKGIVRTLFNWITYTNDNLLAVGTNQKYYVENGGKYYDITPVQSVATLANPFTTVSGSQVITVTHTGYGATVGSFVTYSSVTAFNNVDMTGEFEIIATPTSNTYLVIATTIANASSSGGGAAVVATYQINAGNAVYSIGAGWGVPPWGLGGWGTPSAVGLPLRLWSQSNNNQDLIMAYRGGAIYYWTKDTSSYAPAVTLNAVAATKVKTTKAATFGGGVTSITVPDSLGIDIGATVSGTNITAGTYVTTAYNGGLIVPISTTTGGASSGNYTFSYSGNNAPNQTNLVVTSSTSGFIVAMGSTPYDPTTFTPAFDPMIVRWSDQTNAFDWTPTTFNQSGEQRLTNGSYIIGSVNTRQEILIWTDTSIYSMQYIGPPYVWGFTSLMDNISTISPNCMVTVNGVTYWMGTDKFYVYSGRVDTLPCTLRKFVFTNINLSQAFQIVCGYNERFNEIWWFYPSANSNLNDSYVIYNYLENLWYYGTLNRTAWFDSPLRAYPMGAFSIQTSYLNTAIGMGDTSLSLVNGTSYPSSGVVTIDSEQVSYTGISGNTLTNCVRGFNGTTPATHLIYATVNYSIPNQIMFHENGIDDQSSLTPTAINSFIESSDFDIGGGDHFAFVWRMLPDFAFAGSNAANPQILLTIKPRINAGTAYQTGVDQPSVTSSATFPVELFTGEIYTRVRGRQMAFRVDSPNLGVAWQMGTMRADIRPDGKR